MGSDLPFRPGSAEFWLILSCIAAGWSIAAAIRRRSTYTKKGRSVRVLTGLSFAAAGVTAFLLTDDGTMLFDRVFPWFAAGALIIFTAAFRFPRTVGILTLAAVTFVTVYSERMLTEWHSVSEGVIAEILVLPADGEGIELNVDYGRGDGILPLDGTSAQVEVPVLRFPWYMVQLRSRTWVPEGNPLFPAGGHNIEFNRLPFGSVTLAGSKDARWQIWQKAGVFLRFSGNHADLEVANVPPDPVF